VDICGLWGGGPDGSRGLVRSRDRSAAEIGGAVGAHRGQLWGVSLDPAAPASGKPRKWILRMSSRRFR